jgi:hypothetical protein
MLANRYWQFMMRLGPLLPANNLAGQRLAAIEESGEKFIIDGKGVAHPKGMQVTSWDEATGKPTSVLGTNREDIDQYLKSSWPDAVFEHGWSAPYRGSLNLPQTPLIHPDFELAALKTGLLTFNHLLRDQEFRFTRHDALAPLIQQLRPILDNAANPENFLHNHSLGLQYDKLPQYQTIREQVAHSITEFEHVLIASANSATRTLDMVVWMFSTDSYGFRLCQDWQDDSFTFVVVNGVLKSSTFSNAIYSSDSDTLCAETQRRFAHNKGRDKQQQEIVEGEIMEH